MDAVALEDGLRVAIVLPCRNCGATIDALVRGFRAALPHAEIVVFDQDSRDDTAQVLELAARDHDVGAELREGERNCAPDAAPAAGHQRGLAREQRGSEHGER